jgi:hypothetical protein
VCVVYVLCTVLSSTLIGMKARIDSENEIRMRYRKFLWKNFVQVQIGTIVNSMMSDYISAQRVKISYLLYDRYK